MSFAGDDWLTDNYCPPKHPLSPEQFKKKREASHEAFLFREARRKEKLKKMEEQEEQE